LYLLMPSTCSKTCLRNRQMFFRLRQYSDHYVEPDLTDFYSVFGVGSIR
jgi:hypothetical protein